MAGECLYFFAGVFTLINEFCKMSDIRKKKCYKGTRKQKHENKNGTDAGMYFMSKEM